MENLVTLGQVIGIPAGSCKTYAEEDYPSVSCSEGESVASIKEKKRPGFNWIRKFLKSSENLSTRLEHGKEHISFVFNITN
jgi:hypothetical protein